MKLGGALTMVVVAMVLAACGDDGAAPIDAAAIDAQELDAAPVCLGEPCSLVPQCGCDDTPATPACDLDFNNLATGATKCRADVMHGTESRLCGQPTTCGPGYVCAGRCLRYCNVDDDCPGPGGLCILPILNGNEPVPGVKVCTTDCDPMAVANANCPNTWTCHLYNEAEGDRWLTDCHLPPASGGTLGADCSTTSQCGPTLECVSDMGPGNGQRCRPVCACPGGNCAAGTCAPGTGVCNPYTPAATVGTMTYGRCF